MWQLTKRNTTAAKMSLRRWIGYSVAADYTYASRNDVSVNDGPHIYYHTKKVKVKQSRYRPEVAQRVPGS